MRNVLRSSAVRALAFLVVPLAVGCGSSSADPGGSPSGGGGGNGGGGAGACTADQVTACSSDQQACSGGTCIACGPGTYADDSGACAPIGGTPLTHDFPDVTVGSGDEISTLCESWTLDNPTELWVNAVELEQDMASHHSNWMYVPDDQYDGPDGVWSCADRKYDEVGAALAGGVLYAQSTQATHEVQKFPNGAAIRIPPYARVLHAFHLLNASSQPKTGHMKLTIYSVPLDEVAVKLVPFNMIYHGIDLPPHARSRFTGDADLETAFQSVIHAPFSGHVYYVLPHYHALGVRFFLELIGGPHDGESIIDVDGFDSEARGRAYRDPIDLTGATGIRYGCEFVNPRDVDVKWGIGDQEMCEMLGFADAPLAWISNVDQANPAGQEGTTQLFTGSCGTTAFKWSFDKPGGPPPP